MLKEYVTYTLSRTNLVTCIIRLVLYNIARSRRIGLVNRLQYYTMSIGVLYLHLTPLHLHYADSYLNLTSYTLTSSYQGWIKSYRKSSSGSYAQDLMFKTHQPQCLINYIFYSGRPTRLELQSKPGCGSPPLFTRQDSPGQWSAAQCAHD